jgi:type I restriction enzyme, S subunit
MDYIITTSEYCKKVTDGTHDTPKPCDSGFPLVTSKHINNSVLNISSAYLISKGDYDNINKRSKVEQWDILFSMIGSVGEVYIEREPNPQYAIKNLGLFKMGGNKEKGLNLYYFLKSSYFQRKLKFLLSGSIQSFVTLDFLRKIKIPNYDSNKIKLIQEIEIISNKISNNAMLLSCIEEYFQLLFRQWFVDFNFPDENGKPYKDAGGEMVIIDGKYIPSLWQEIPMTDSITFINGLAMQKFPPKDELDLLPVIKIREISNNCFDKDTEYVTKTINKSLVVNDGDILFPWSGSLSVNIWTGGLGGLNQHIFKVQSEKFAKWYIYLWIKHHMRYFEQIAYGKKTTMGHINRKHLGLVNVRVPDEKTLGKMNERMAPIYKKITNLSIENGLLKEYRVLLINKLIK